MLPYLLVFFGGYLLGSIPTGFLLVKRQSNIDITKSGSGNVGAFNAGVVTGSKWIGIAVGVLDGFKGIAAILLAGLWWPEFGMRAFALLSTIVGHNYPVWLRFKGGRGLAAAAGGSLVLAPSYLIVWCTTWAVLKWQKQTILGANILATMVTPLVLFLIPAQYLEAVSFFGGTAFEIRWFVVAAGLLFVLSHLDGFRELSRKKESEAI